ncbi:hypothetical protein HQ39_06405 [Porphyromonas sp. COT-108 OH2963]|uniref:ADP-ribosyltransferase-containing protein n=1 Tax=Porphyromonas sp. COT-108 OH2963 TaxID=1515614 RepID=UPI00052E2A1C|nr:hypothetical protein [Porphyromonas sp. COT-108 OH2963]KGN95141.1 hypothetical protein HQ39_06405 [Porphyromonas sp. COT-108 OH2963]
MEMVKAQDKELKRIYQTLSKNFDGIGSEDEFKKRMQDEGSRRKVFDYLKSIDGSLKDFDTFSDRIVVRPNLNMRVSNEYGEEEFLPRRGSKTTIQDNSKDGSPSQRNSTPIRRFDEGFMQGGKALIQGGKALAGETANLFTGSSRDASEAIKVLNDFDALGIDIDSYEKSLGAKLKYRDYLYSKARREWGDMSKKDRGFISEALWRISNPEPQRYQYNKEDNKGAIKALRKAIEESGGDKKKAVELLSKWSKDKTWGDEIISEAGKELSEQRPVEGAAWFGNLLPQMVPNIAAVASSLHPATRPLARPLAQIGMSGMTASATGQAMAEARQYSEQEGKKISDGDIWKSGITSGAIEYATEKIPLDYFFGWLKKPGVKNSIGNAVGKVVEDNPIARQEMSKLAEKASRELGADAFGRKTLLQLAKDSSVEGASEFAAEYLGAFVPVIYQNPEDYPTLSEALRNGFEGAKAGLFMGGVIGGPNRIASNYVNKKRRQAQGAVYVVESKDGNISEVLGLDKNNNLIVQDFDGNQSSLLQSDIAEYTSIPFEQFSKGFSDQVNNIAEKSREEGYSIEDPTQKNQAKMLYDKSREVVESIWGGDPDEELLKYGNTPAEQLHSLSESGTDEETIQTVSDYINARSAYEGMIDKVIESVDLKISQDRETIQSNANKDGNVYTTKIHGRDETEYYIVGGDIHLLEDGSGDVDKESSSGSVVVKDSSTGALEMVSIDQLSGVQSTPIEDLLSELETTVRQNEMQRLAGEIDGDLPFNSGDVYEIDGPDGSTSSVQILQSNPDGSVVVSDGHNQEVAKREDVQALVDLKKRNDLFGRAKDEGNESRMQYEPGNVVRLGDGIEGEVVRGEDADGNILVRVEKDGQESVIQHPSKDIGTTDVKDSANDVYIPDKIENESDSEEQNKIKPPVDKNGNIDYDSIGDAQMYADALVSEFPDDVSLQSEIINDEVDRIQAQIDHISSPEQSKGKRRIEIEREKKALKERLRMLKQAEELLNPKDIQEDETSVSVAENIDASEDKQQGDNELEDEVPVSSFIEEMRESIDTNPSEAQKEAGNYKKGHVKVDGFSITIENPKNSERSGKDKDGVAWSVTMRNDYGYILGTKGKDGDHIDIFLSDSPEEGSVFVVDQIKEDGSFDEHKVMYGFSGIEEAKAAYLSNYSPGWKGLGNITEVSKENFKKWIKSSKRKTKPFAEYSSMNREEKNPDYLNELEEFRKQTDTSGRTKIDEAAYDSEELYAPLLVDGMPSKLAVLTAVSDNITDPAIQIAVYDYSDEIDEKTNEGWQKWADLSDEYNSGTKAPDKAIERGDTGSLGFRTVDAALEFADWFEKKKAGSILFREGQTNVYSDEERSIISKAKDEGIFMLAPNGNPTNLNENQWVQVRTKAFKDWFGDWEKVARVEKLRKSEPVILQGNEHEGKYELNRDSAKAWIKDNLRGEYTISDTGETVAIGRKGVNKATSHSMGNEAHLKSLVAVPQLLEKSIFIAEEKAEKKGAQYPIYRYYITGIQIGGEDYTAKLTIGVDENGRKYYDHALTEIEKGKLLDQLNGQVALEKGFISMGAEPDPSVALSRVKDTKLVSLLQTNASKVVDENGEPMVVYHGTLSKSLTEFSKDFIGSRYSFDDKGFFFISSKKIAEDYATSEFDSSKKGEVVDAYVELKTPLIIDDNWCRKNGLGKNIFKDYDVIGFWDSYQSLIIEESENNDGVIIYDGKSSMVVAFEPNQIKSASENVGTFYSENPSILFRESDTPLRESEEEIFARGQLSDDIPEDFASVHFAYEPGLRHIYANPEAYDKLEAMYKENGGYLEEGWEYEFSSEDFTLKKGYVCCKSSNEYEYPAMIPGAGDDSYCVFFEGEEVARIYDGVVAKVGKLLDVWKRQKGGSYEKMGVQKSDYSQGGNLKQINERFNDDLFNLTEENAGRVILSLGTPNAVLKSVGIKDMPIRLYGGKVIKKAKKHGYKAIDLRDLPQAMSDPIFIFKGSQENSFAILTELTIGNNSILISLSIGKGGADVDFNIVSSIYGKENNSVLSWLTNDRALYINKKKALDYIASASAPIADAKHNNQELISATKVIKEFENPSTGDKDVRLRDADGANKGIGNGTERIEQAVKDLAEKLGENIRIVKDVREIKSLNKGTEIRMQRSKGWYDLSSGEVVLLLENATSEADARATVFHEVVGHKGLRELFGDDFDAFLDRVYSQVSVKSRERINEKAKEKGWDFRMATEEYMAELAERGFSDNEEHSFWRKVKSLFMKLLDKASVKLGFSLTDDDLRYILWRSYKKMTDKSLLAEADNVSMKNKLGIGAFREKGRIPENNYRDEEKPVTGVAREYYEEKVKGFGYKMMEGYVDHSRGLLKFQEALEKEHGKPIEAHENAYLGLNRLSSVNTFDMEDYMLNYFKPLMKSVADVSDKSKSGYNDLCNYLIAKHGLERNEYMAEKKAVEALFKGKDVDSELARKTKESFLNEKEALKKRLEDREISTAEFRRDLEDLRHRYLPRYRRYRAMDHSGLSALTGDPVNFESLSKELVSEYEKGRESEIQGLWDKIRSATGETLKKAYHSGLISRQQYEHISGMYQ